MGKMDEKVKCSGFCRRRMTRTPQAAGWSYMGAAPAEAQHWIGWWCPQCWAELRLRMGVEPPHPRLQ
jgi:hypothetical protein